KPPRPAGIPRRQAKTRRRPDRDATSGRLEAASPVAPDVARDHPAAVARDDTVYDNPLAGTQPPVRALVRFAKVDGDGTAVGHELHSGAADPLYPPGQTGALLRVGCLRTEREASQASESGKQRPWHRHGAQARARRGRQQWDVGPMEPRAAT